MKRLITLLAILTLGISVVACKNVETSSAMKQGTAEIIVAGPVKLENKGVVEVSGKGFNANSKIMVLFTTVDGVESDIGYALKPEPIADASGSWKTEWSYGRFVKKQLVTEGTYSMSVVDEDFNELAKTSVMFVK